MGSDSCTTDGSGQCSIDKSNINMNSTSATFTVDSVTHASNVYESGANHDPDPDSNGTTLVVARP